MDQVQELLRICRDSFRFIQHVLYKGISLVLWLFIDHAYNIVKGYTTVRYTEEEYAQYGMINRLVFFAPGGSSKCLRQIEPT